MSAIKAKDANRNLGVNGGRGAPMTWFHEYNLETLGVPMECRPMNGDTYFGKHGYTIKSTTGAVFWMKFTLFQFPDPSTKTSSLIHSVGTFSEGKFLFTPQKGS